MNVEKSHVGMLGPLPQEDAQSYLDGFQGRNDLKVGPNMLAWALESMLARLDEAAAALAKLQAERDEAREALRPFANLGAALPEHYSHDSRFHGPGHPRFWHEIDPENIWNARSVIDRAASRALGGGE